ncbi:MAG: glutathione S-transferase family protein [Solirubrobacteraceae bacterium]
MRLYDSRVSGNCYKVRLLLAQLGVEYERHEVDVIDRSGRAGLLGEMNPALRIPTIVLDDGRALAESNAIMWYFADGTSLSPADAFERAKVLQWLFFEQYSHEPYIAVLRYWLTIARSAPSQSELDAKRAGGYAALAAMERQLGATPFLVGEAYTIADVGLYAYTHVANEAGLDLSRHPAVVGWLERVAAQPAHVPITA